MNWKILLVVLLLSVGAGLYLAREMGVFKTEEVRGPETEKLLTVDLDNIDRLKISFLDTTYVVRKHMSEWKIESPYPAEMADSLTVNHLLRVLTSINVLRKIPLDSISLAQVNLDVPVMSFDIEFRDGSRTGVGFGVLNPTTENIYTRRTDEDSVILISRIMGPSLAFTGNMIRSRQLINLPVLRINRLELDSGRGGSLVLSMDPETGIWWREAPDGRVMIDKRPVLVLLERLHLAEVREFYDSDEADEAESGLGSPVRRLVVEDLDGGRNEVRLGRKEVDRPYLIWAASTVYPENLLLVDSLLVGQFDRLNHGNLTLRKLAPIDVNLADRISLKYQDSELELTAESDTLWRIVKPREINARFWQVERILGQVDTMEAVTVLPSQTGGRGFDAPQLDLSLYHRDSLLGRYLIGDYSGTDIFFRDVRRGQDFLVPPRTLERLSWTFDELADIPVRHVVQ